jgi:hypothetical protein
MTASIKTFWGALLSVLLKCIAGVGFATQDRAADSRQVAAADGMTAITAPTTTPTVGDTAPLAVETRAEVAVAAPVSDAPAPAGPSAPPRRRGAGARIPAPRATESRLVRRSRGRTLPPTMKQRIGAEAHGTSPSARSLRNDDGLDEFGDLSALAAAAGAPADGTDHTHGAHGTDRGSRSHRENSLIRSGEAQATRDRFVRAA